MKLTEQFREQGNWLFRWRSYMPLALLPLLLLALPSVETITGNIGPRATFIYRLLCFIIALTGFYTRAIAAAFVPRGTSGQNTKIQKAETLNTEGVYSIVRHPLYLGNFLVFEGIMLYTGVWWLAVLSIFFFFIYYERIMYAEEAFLQDKFSDAFDEWAAQTPAFFPKFSLWKRPALKFSLRNILKREHNTFMTLITGFTLVHYGGDFLSNLSIESGAFWLWVFIITLIVFQLLRIIKKKTSILNVHGR